MNISDFDYFLPDNLVAREPAKPRDYSKLLVLDKKTGQIQHRHFFELIDFLKPGDIIVLNNSKVSPARLIGRKETGGQTEILLNHEISPGIWEALGKKLKIGDKAIFAKSLEGEILSKDGETVIIKFNLSSNALIEMIDKIGQTPLPPYILKQRRSVSANRNDSVSYQTVYARYRGSVAAPTAGFHFTKNLLNKISAKDVKILELTLHVGLGTFAPVKVERIADHKIHFEYYSIDEDTLKEIIAAKKTENRIIAVGTTTTRVLETIFQNCQPSTCLAGRQAVNCQRLSGWTDIFIYPPYKFKCVDAMITNFHLPKSTLLLLVSAFAGKDKIKKAYSEAIRQRYRFYSYGDAMMII